MTVYTMPPEGALGEMPDALIHAFLERRPRAATTAGPGADPIPEGGRNAALTSLAGTMRRRGMTAAAIAAALHAENTERCNPPLPEEEVDTIARSVASYPAAEAPTVAPSAAGFVFASNVAVEHVEWLWQDRIPRGALTVLAGDPGLGKSLLTMELAARVSRGQAIAGDAPTEPATVAVLTAEDALGAVVRPRLEAAGADLSRVALWDDAGETPITFPSGIEPLAAFVREHRPALIIIDPVVSFLDANLNAHRDQDVRAALRRLAALAAETGAAIVVVMHLNKASGGQPMYRLGGSIGFAGAARSVLLFGRVPDADHQDPRRAVAVVKSSYAPPAATFELTLTNVEGGQHPRVTWGSEMAVGATELLAGPGDPDQRSQATEAAAWLREELTDGPRPAAELKHQADAQGIADRTLRRAKETLRIVSRKNKDGWTWELPEGGHATPVGPLATLATLAPFDGQADLSKSRTSPLATLDHADPEGTA